ncbi:MAG: hypothetical protein MJZ39_03705 [Bacteroidales bacterium]|nr:hypothetical protein [Bacteroidales bacterium]
MKHIIYSIFSMVGLMLLLSIFNSCDDKSRNFQNNNFNADLQADSTVMEFTAEMISLYDEDIKYLRRQKGADEAVQALEDIKKLVVQNDYVLNTPETVEKYNQYLRKYAESIQRQPAWVQNRIAKMK